MASIEQALLKLLPNVEWKITDGDLSQLEIFTKGVKAPTQDEVDRAIETIDLANENEILIKAERKAVLLEKLGITENEAKLLFS